MDGRQYAIFYSFSFQNNMFLRRLEIDKDNQQFDPYFLPDLDSNQGTFQDHTIKPTQAQLFSLNSDKHYSSIYNPFEGSNSINSVYPLRQSSCIDPSSMRSKVKQRKRSLMVEMISQGTPLHSQMKNMKDVKRNKKMQHQFTIEKENVLENIIKVQKIKNLQKNFIKKIHRTLTFRPPVQFTKLQENQDVFSNIHGISIPPVIDNIINLLSVLQIMGFLYVYSLTLVFNFEDIQFITYAQSFSVVFYCLQMILNILTVKSQAGKKITLVKQIFGHYLAKNFWIDSIIIFILLLDINSNAQLTLYLRFFIFFKLDSCMDKIQKIQVFLIQNVYKQQYWQLAKVFFVNFLFAHIIALFLIEMTSFNSINWITEKHLLNVGWFEQYVWAFYWGTTIMLTVGFGDITATNYKEALCLIFIQTFSCIIMAYNINRVGSIISNIRRQDQNRSKKLKIFKKLTDQNQVSQELIFKINNYIEQSSRLHKQFNFQQDQQFIKQLPETLKTNYLRESNKEVLNKLFFFRGLLQKTLCNFAQHLQISIAHPQQIIRSLQDDFDLKIVKSGRIGYTCVLNGSCFDKEIVDQIQVKHNLKPFLTSLDFLTKKHPKYEIKSLRFSIMYILKYSHFMEIFRQGELDYQLFCFLRDKIHSIPDQFQVYQCEICDHKVHHFKFDCPRLHYIPFPQHITDKYLHSEKLGKNIRMKFKRNTKGFELQALEYYKVAKDCVKSTKRPSQEIQNFIIGKISENKTLPRTLEDSIMPRQQILSASFVESKTKEIISMEFNRQNKLVFFNDEVWGVALDLMTNYNSYFPLDNPVNINVKFNHEDRIKKKWQYLAMKGSHLTRELNFPFEFQTMYPEGKNETTTVQQENELNQDSLNAK